MIRVDYVLTGLCVQWYLWQVFLDQDDDQHKSNRGCSHGLVFIASTNPGGSDATSLSNFLSLSSILERPFRQPVLLPRWLKLLLLGQSPQLLGANQQLHDTAICHRHLFHWEPSSANAQEVSKAVLDESCLEPPTFLDAGAWGVTDLLPTTHDCIWMFRLWTSMILWRCITLMGLPGASC